MFVNVFVVESFSQRHYSTSRVLTVVTFKNCIFFLNDLTFEDFHVNPWRLYSANLLEHFFYRCQTLTVVLQLRHGYCGSYQVIKVIHRFFFYHHLLTSSSCFWRLRWCSGTRSASSSLLWMSSVSGSPTMACEVRTPTPPPHPTPVLFLLFSYCFSVMTSQEEINSMNW